MKKRILCSLLSTDSKRFLNTIPQKEKKIFQWIKPTGTDTGISVYNPVTKCKTPLVIKNDDFLTWYMCGPTLYNSAHIGHACTYVRFDIIKRILNDIFNINVIQIMGLTDVDDKIIKRSQELKQDWRQLTKFYEQEFVEDMNKLNVIKPYHNCRVTDYIPQIIQFVKQIIKQDFAYVAENGSVYFDATKYQNYGKLNVPQSNDDTSNPQKKSVIDFALWKSSKEGEPFWESPWGNGRPGWHIECSTIASTIFGSNIDIHSGGIDLAFPHHENEEAQSCCYHNEEQWINYWLHSGHLYLKNNTKMSKSLQNTITIESLLQQYSANEFRFLCLMSNYKNGIEFSDDIMKNSVSILKKIEHFLQSCNDYVSGKLYKGVVNESALMAVFYQTKSNVLHALKDDFNTGKAIMDIIHLIGVANKMLCENETKISARSTVAIAAVSKYVSSILSKLGISNLETAKMAEQNNNGIVESYVKFRTIVRNKGLSGNKDIDLLKACDTAREDLSTYGIEVKDCKDTATWIYVKNRK